MLVATLAVVVVIGVIGPFAMVSIGERRARACLARWQSPRSETDVPECGNEMYWFIPPAYVPWTSWNARYRAEELVARLAVSAYVDAAVGRSDPAALASARPALEAAERTVQRGSRRLAMDDLGRAIGAPNVGRLAQNVGDRATLLERFDTWGDWHVRLSVLEAALAEGDLDRALVIARRYSDFDPRDEDLRTAVGAILCMGGEPSRGLPMLVLIQDDRASRRYAAMSRDWGEVRAAIVACAARAKVAPPPKPERPEAGRGDAPEPRAALRLRLLLDEGRAAGTPELGQAVTDVAELLEEPRSSIGRRALLAWVIEAQDELDAGRLAKLARAREEEGESPLVASHVVTPVEILAEPDELRPIAPPEVCSRSAARVEKLLGDEKNRTSPLSPDDARALRTAGAALRLEAGRDFALAGEPEAAAAELDAGLALAGAGAVARSLARSTAFAMSMQWERALAELDGVDLDRAASDPPGRAARAAALIQRVEALAALGRHDDARAAVEPAVAAARESGDRALELRALWTRVAFGDVRAGDGPAAFRWLGFADATSPWTRGSAAFAAESTLEAWTRARLAPAAERLAARYLALSMRGDAPPWHGTHLALAASIAPERGDVETWLDAFYAVDFRRISRRAHAFWRATAARFRGDARSAKTWDGRYRALVRIASDPSRRELARYLNL